MRKIIRLPFLALFALVSLGAPLVGMAGDNAFVGSKKCKMCHMKQYKSWEATTMAQSFENLKPGNAAEAKKAAGLDADKDYTTDAKCLGCHTTGYGKPGGFVDIATTPDLVGVGCEMCHGAGAGYLADGLMTLKNKEYKKADVVAAGMVDTVSAAQCTPCHNKDDPFKSDDFVFDYEANKDAGIHEHIPLKYAH